MCSSGSGSGSGSSSRSHLPQMGPLRWRFGEDLEGLEVSAWEIFDLYQPWRHRVQCAKFLTCLTMERLIISPVFSSFWTLDTNSGSYIKRVSMFLQKLVKTPGTGSWNYSVLFHSQLKSVTVPRYTFIPQQSRQACAFNFPPPTRPPCVFQVYSSTVTNKRPQKT